MKAIAALLLMLGCPVAWTQGFDPMGIQRQTMISPGNLLAQGDFKKELKLDRDQDRKISEITKDYRKRSDAAMKTSQTGDFNAMSNVIQTMKAIEDDTNANVASVLNPDQSKRLREMQWQVMGAKSLYEPDLQKLLNLTPEQIAKIDEYRKGEMGRMMQAMQGGSDPRKTAEGLKKQRAETKVFLMGCLTPEQAAAFKDAMGKEVKAATKMAEMFG